MPFCADRIAGRALAAAWLPHSKDGNHFVARAFLAYTLFAWPV
ncbi:hypothetical protein [Chloroflexus aurantiacus]